MLSSRARGLVFEGIVIVVSILVAFVLDAWWDGVQLDRDLDDELRNVAEEIDSNIESLRLEIFMQETALRSVDELVEAIDAAGDAPSLEVPDTLVLSAMIFVPSYDPATGALDALIATGKLSRLRDAELRGTLSRFRTQVEDAREDELEARRVSTESILPAYWSDPGITSSMGRAQEYYDRGMADVALPTVAVRIQNLDGLKNRLLYRSSWLEDAVSELRQLEEDLERARVALALERATQ